MNSLNAEAEISLKLNSAFNFPPDSRKKILKEFGASLWTMPVERWAEASGLSYPSAERLKREAFSFNAEKEMELAKSLGARISFEWEESYPQVLKTLPHAPLALYVLGEFSESNSLAIVGTRTPTSYGRRMAARFSQQAISSGLTVVSGLARGIDTEAHQAAVENAGKTWAVLGSGFLNLYPSENKKLAEKIVQAGGCLLSEFPLETRPWPACFPMRNRIISGLSWGVMVVEGKEKSGSLITAKIAAEQGRAVFAVPGPVDSPLSEAPHLLISQGAKLVSRFDDVLEDMPPSCFQEKLKTSDSSFFVPDFPSPLSLTKRKILQFIGSQSLALEEIASGCGLDIASLSSALFELEMDGLIMSEPGQHYAIKKRN